MKPGINIVLFDDSSWVNLLPLTFTRPVSELRVGILKIREKWEKRLHTSVSFLTEKYLSHKYSLKEAEDNMVINSSIIPDKNLVNAIIHLNKNQILVSGNEVIAGYLLSGKHTIDFNYQVISGYSTIEYNQSFTRIHYPWDIFRCNGQEIIADYELLTHNRKTEKLSASNQLLGKENIFAEQGVKAEYITLNATTGPIYLGRDSEIMEGSLIRGPFSLGEYAVLKMASKIYGPTTIGPHSKVGGEVNNSVIQGYSNKAHDGFLGNSIIGEWCNLGADTNNSNLKNNYAEVKLWNYLQETFINTGLQFCGLVMGDHSKCGINTMFNTGTVVGVSANIFGPGFPRNFIPSFSWGGAQGFTEFALNKAFEVAEQVMARRNIKLDEVERNILKEVFNRTAKYRKYSNQ